MKTFIRKCIETTLWPELVSTSIVVALLLIFLAWFSTLF